MGRGAQKGQPPVDFKLPGVALKRIWSSLIVALHLLTGWRMNNPSIIHPLLVGVLGLILAFRTNQAGELFSDMVVFEAYERHWSCAKQLTEMQRVLQTMLRYAAHLSRDDWEIYSCIVRHLIAFPIALKQHLKRSRDPEEYSRVLEYSELDGIGRTGRPHTLLLSSLSMLIRPLRHRDDGLGKSLALWNQMDTCISQLQSISCNLDLVVQVPLPASYTIHADRFIRLWVGTLPFVLLDVMRPAGAPGEESVLGPAVTLSRACWDCQAVHFFLRKLLAVLGELPGTGRSE
ncbi:unnamed protein product [Symbiodinium natans]|uniref:Uncharacterized protein n=1 Tax=Symbiodinium natans TaxID=878477 RepID=A0A812VC12_9DINO|nr:unnamed protein product [Symbiodinium natans]